MTQQLIEQLRTIWTTNPYLLPSQRDALTLACVYVERESLLRTTVEFATNELLHGHLSVTTDARAHEIARTLGMQFRAMLMEIERQDRDFQT